MKIILFVLAVLSFGSLSAQQETVFSSNDYETANVVLKKISCANQVSYIFQNGIDAFLKCCEKNDYCMTCADSLKKDFTKIRGLLSEYIDLSKRELASGEDSGQITFRINLPGEINETMTTDEAGQWQILMEKFINMKTEDEKSQDVLVTIVSYWNESIIK